MKMYIIDFLAYLYSDISLYLHYNMIPTYMFLYCLVETLLKYDSEAFILMNIRL